MRYEDLAEGIRQWYVALSATWTERQRPHRVAGEAKAAVYPGVTRDAGVTGISRRAIPAGFIAPGRGGSD